MRRIKPLDIHTLLIKVRGAYEREINKEERSRPGLCSVIHYLRIANRINRADYDILETYLKENRPSYKIKVYCPYNELQLILGYWWLPDSTKPRLRWLDNHIELTKPN